MPSCLALPCLALSCRVVSCRVVSCRVVSCRVLSCLAFLVASRRVVACLVRSGLFLSCLVSSCLVLFCFVLSIYVSCFVFFPFLSLYCACLVSVLRLLVWSCLVFVFDGVLFSSLFCFTSSICFVKRSRQNPHLITRTQVFVSNRQEDKTEQDKIRRGKMSRDKARQQKTVQLNRQKTGQDHNTAQVKTGIRQG